MNASNHSASAQSSEPITASELVGLEDAPILDPYLLRGLAWCGFCDRELVAVLVATGARYYGCPTKQCTQTLVPAEPFEHLVWQRFSLLNEVAAAAVKHNERQRALRELLRRVTVHRDMIDLWFEWRD
jgi:hypothetical protein